MLPIPTGRRLLASTLEPPPRLHKGSVQPAAYTWPRSHHPAPSRRTCRHMGAQDGERLCSLVPQPLQSWLVQYAGTATTRSLAHAACIQRGTKLRPVHPAPAAREYGPRLTLAATPSSRFAQLLRVATEMEALPR